MNTNYKQLTRSSTNRMIAGVCAGLGAYSNIDPTVVRSGLSSSIFLSPDLALLWLI